MLVSIIIPTVDRETGLTRAVCGVAQQVLSFGTFEIVIVDNSFDARQGRLIEQLTGLVPKDVHLRYVHEPRPGLAFARNCGIANSRGDFVVFLDDDESPVDNLWLANLVGSAVEKDSDIAFGPVKAVLESEPSLLSEFVIGLHSRDLKKDNQADITQNLSDLGTGNSCFRRSSCFESDDHVFSSAFNHSGGEDIDLLRRLRSRGRIFVWASKAAVYEFLPVSRSSPAYLAERRFRQGQQRVYLLLSSKPRRYDAALFWMTVGLFQISYHFIARERARLSSSRQKFLLHEIKMAGGMGKLFWQRRYRIDRYGLATL